MKTFSAKPHETERSWWIVDLDGKTVGRVATQIASVLRGKHKPTYTPHMDEGDFVIVVNAEKVVFTGRKTQQKTYWRHSGFPGGIKSMTADKMLQRHPERVILEAVRGMLPKGPLGRKMIRKFKIYTGPDHPHAAQQPESMDV